MLVCDWDVVYFVVFGVWLFVCEYIFGVVVGI